MAAKEFIVAIELGSSKITGIAGKKNMDGSIQVLAVVREDATPCIRKGVVYNIDKTSACLINIINKLKTLLKSEISQVYVGVGGQSIRCIPNNSVKTLPEDTIITQEMVNELMDNNRCTRYTDLEILDAATQEYKVGTLYQVDPVGIQSDKIEGNFLNIVYRKSFYRNLVKCFEKAKISIAEMYLAPIALAQSILTETEMRSGCLLVDLGADTTTVSVYYKNILRHLAVIPLGGNNITKDISTLMMEDDEAEEMKIKYGKAFIEPTDIDTDETLPIDAERSVSAKAFNELVESRVDEIIQNVWFGQVPPKYYDKLMGGIILTGGGSRMKEIKKAFTDITGIQKVRIADTVNQKVTSTDRGVYAHDGTMNTALALLAKGDINCAGSAIKPIPDLFDTEERPINIQPDTPRTKASKMGETGQMDYPEKKPSSEKKRKPQEKDIREKPNTPHKDGWISRGYGMLQDFYTKIISAENEDEYDD
ncbi:MAG: cell division protein FtsA [Prevotella sp.]|nr:cell division protein FtsA [Prevotella sp.]